MVHLPACEAAPTCHSCGHHYNCLTATAYAHLPTTKKEARKRGLPRALQPYLTTTRVITCLPTSSHDQSSFTPHVYIATTHAPARSSTPASAKPPHTKHLNGRKWRSSHQHKQRHLHPKPQQRRLHPKPHQRHLDPKPRRRRHIQLPRLSPLEPPTTHPAPPPNLPLPRIAAHGRAEPAPRSSAEAAARAQTDIRG
jgi:hypothetical protein